MEPMPYAEPGGIASAGAYNAVVDNVDELGRGTLLRRYAATAQSIGDSTWVRLSFQESVSSCPHVTVNAAADTFTIVTPGSYDLSACVRFELNSTGTRHLLIGGNSSSTRYDGLSIPADSEHLSLSVSTSRPFEFGDIVSIWVRQNSGGSLDTNPNTELIHVAIRYCGES